MDIGFMFVGLSFIIFASFLIIKRKWNMDFHIKIYWKNQPSEKYTRFFNYNMILFGIFCILVGIILGFVGLHLYKW